LRFSVLIVVDITILVLCNVAHWFGGWYRHSEEPVDSVFVVEESSVQEVETAGYSKMLRASHSRRPLS
jgi:hypothetical protein